VSKLSRAVKPYKGEIWWLPLSKTVRDKLDLDKYFDWLEKQEGKKYDIGQLIPRALDFLGPLTKTQEDYEKLGLLGIGCWGIKSRRGGSEEG